METFFNAASRRVEVLILRIGVVFHEKPSSEVEVRTHGFSPFPLGLIRFSEASDRRNEDDEQRSVGSPLTVNNKL
jgi:hypothetical protein